MLLATLTTILYLLFKVRYVTDSHAQTGNKYLFSPTTLICLAFVLARRCNLYGILWGLYGKPPAFTMRTPHNQWRKTDLNRYSFFLPRLGYLRFTLATAWRGTQIVCCLSTCSSYSGALYQSSAFLHFFRFCETCTICFIVFVHFCQTALDRREKPFKLDFSIIVYVTSLIYNIYYTFKELVCARPSSQCG